MTNTDGSQTLSGRDSGFILWRSFANGCTDWWRTDGLTWVYAAKMVLAVILALLIAMRLDLPQPRTAMITVCILMQPQSGLVLAKSIYRFIGTVVGLIVMLCYIDLFAQTPVLYLTAIAIWVCICTVGAARNRNFRSYGFVLAGYTAALIGIPSGQHPEGAFIAAMTRVAETSVGILSAGAVSALVFPLYVGKQIKAMVRGRFITLSKNDWRIEYNTERPHSSLGYLAPAQFAKAHEAKELLTLDSNGSSYYYRGQVRITVMQIPWVNRITRVIHGYTLLLHWRPWFC